MSAAVRDINLTQLDLFAAVTHENSFILDEDDSSDIQLQSLFSQKLNQTTNCVEAAATASLSDTTRQHFRLLSPRGQSVMFILSCICVCSDLWQQYDAN